MSALTGARRTDIKRRLVKGARQRAKRAGVPCTVEVEDIDLPTHCPVLGRALRSFEGCGKGPRNDSPTLDKIVPALGYVPGNILVVSQKANRLKNQLSPTQLALFARFYAEAERRMKENLNART